MSRTVHVIGAGLAGLSAASRLAQAGDHVVVHEAGAQAGGRCRSYHDAALGMTIDNGNHVILSGNTSALSFLDLVGGRGRMRGGKDADFNFVDLATGERWQLRLSDGRIPWWIFSAARRVPKTRVNDYLVLARLMWLPGKGTVGDVMPCSGVLYERLIEPLLLATLNNDPPAASARLAATLLRETVGAGGRNCRPLIAQEGLSFAFVDPALDYLKAKDVSVRFGHELHSMSFDGKRAARLDFGADAVALAPNDAVVLAVPPNVAARLLPGQRTPTEFRAIANVHFRVDDPTALAADDRRGAFADALDFRLSGAPVGDHQQRQFSHAVAARRARAQGLDRGGGGRGAFRDAAALAGRARAPRHHRHRSRPRILAPATRNGVDKCAPRR